MDPFVQVLEPSLEACLVVPPRHTIHAGGGLAFERVERRPQRVSTLRSAVNCSFFLSFATFRTRYSAWVTRARSCARCVLCCPALPLVPGLGSADSAAGRPALFVDFTAVGSEEAPTEGLASVRRSNWTCSFPASSFHEWVLAI